MSARHRQAKKKLRKPREERARLLELSDAYALVRADLERIGYTGRFDLVSFHGDVRDEIDEHDREIGAWELPPR